MPPLPQIRPQYHNRNIRRPESIDSASAIRSMGQMFSDVIQGGEDKKTARLEFQTRLDVAEYHNNIEQAKINTQNQLALLQEEFETNPLAVNKEEYYQAQSKVIEDNSTLIEGEVAQEKFQRDVSSMAIQYGIQSRALRHVAVIDDGQTTAQERAEQFVDSPNRNDLMREMMDEKTAIGIYSEAEAKDFMGETDFEWGLDDAGKSLNNAKWVLKQLKEGNPDYLPNLSEAQKNKLAQQIRTGTIPRLEYGNADTAVTILKEVDFGGKPREFYSNIEEAKLIGAIKETEANAMILAYQREREIDESTEPETFKSLSLQVDAVDARKGEAPMGNSLSYANQTRELYTAIYKAYGEMKLTYPHLQALLKDAGVSTAGKAELVKQQMLNPEEAEKTYTSNQAAFDSFMLYTDKDVARANNLMMEYISYKSEATDDKMTTLLPSIIYRDKIRRAEKATTAAVRLLTIKPKGKPEQFTVTPYKRTPVKAILKTERVVNGVTYIKSEGGWKKK